MEQMAEEYCYMVAMNNSGRILGVFFISKGTVNASLITPRELYVRALLLGAVRIILCHNHPSGNVLPSEQDITITKKIKEVGELINKALPTISLSAGTVISASTKQKYYERMVPYEMV